MGVNNTQANLAATKKKYHMLGWLHNAFVWLLYLASIGASFAAAFMAIDPACWRRRRIEPFPGLVPTTV